MSTYYHGSPRGRPGDRPLEVTIMSADEFVRHSPRAPGARYARREQPPTSRYRRRPAPPSPTRVPRRPSRRLPADYAETSFVDVNRYYRPATERSYRPYAEPAPSYSAAHRRPRPREPARQLFYVHTSDGLRPSPYAPTYVAYPAAASVYRSSYPGRARPAFPDTFSQASPASPAAQDTHDRWRANLLVWRLVLKIAQLISGFFVVGLVVAPARGVVFHDWLALVRAEGQLAVLIVTIICILASFLLLFSISLATNSDEWQSVDAIFTTCCALLMCIAMGVEGWYAGCYPPTGFLVQRSLPFRNCYLPEWIIAAVFALVAVVLYVVDLAMIARSGKMNII